MRNGCPKKADLRPSSASGLLGELCSLSVDLNTPASINATYQSLSCVVMPVPILPPSRNLSQPVVNS
jgi:hypothetical protein